LVTAAGQSVAPVMRDLTYFDLAVPGFSLYADAV
jgi:hypothetical protein